MQKHIEIPEAIQKNIAARLNAVATEQARAEGLVLAVALLNGHNFARLSDDRRSIIVDLPDSGGENTQ